MQGSVEKTSCGQMNNINKYGCYTVGSNDEASCSSLSKLICLNLQRCHKPGAQQKYTMDELRDLESKLVLIIGKESDEKEHYGKVSQFMTPKILKLKQTFLIIRFLIQSVT